MSDNCAFPGGAETLVRLLLAVESAAICLLEKDQDPVRVSDLPLHPLGPTFLGPLRRLHIGIHHYGQPLRTQRPDEVGDALLMLGSRVGVTNEYLGQMGDHVIVASDPTWRVTDRYSYINLG